MKTDKPEMYTVRVLVDGEAVDKRIEHYYPNVAARLFDTTVDVMRRMSDREATVQLINPDGSIEYEKTIERT